MVDDGSGRAREVDTGARWGSRTRRRGRAIRGGTGLRTRAAQPVSEKTYGTPWQATKTRASAGGEYETGYNDARLLHRLVEAIHKIRLPRRVTTGALGATGG